MRKDIFLALMIFLSITAGMSAFAQRPGGGRGPGGFDPDEMIKREKQNVFKAIEDLSDDQELLLDGIYDEFSLSFKELRDEMRQTRDFQAMRPKMEALRDEKDGLIKDVLSEDQFVIYEGLMDNRRKQMQENAQRRRDGQNRPPMAAADSLQSESN
jgi:hypothetical protein